MADPASMATAAAGALAGGGMTTWFIRAMVNRVLTQYDEKHKQADSKINALEIKNAALEVRIAEVGPLREEVGRLRERLAIAENKLCRAWESIERVKTFSAQLAQRLKQQGDF